MDKMASLWAKFKRKAFVIKTPAEVLGPFDLLALGVGCIIGAGIVVLTGVAAHDYAGPAVVLSYTLSGIAAMIAALCYAEYAASFPVAGGAFNYIALTFGEFAAWVTACDLILEYTLSAAAVAKGFTAYFASLLGLPLNKLRFEFSIFTFDLPACASVIVLSLVLARSTSESSLLNIIVVVVHMLLIVFVLAAGFPFAQAENYSPFMPFGFRGVFTGASVVFFSFIGFDTVATAAEEVKNPARDLPIGIVGSLSICTVLYVLMCLVITGMQPYDQIDVDAPFSAAFDSVGLAWARRIVAAGALAGIVTSLLGSLLGQARIYITLGRQQLLPPWLAKVSPKTGTPINATLVTMCTAGLLALFLDIELLAELVSIGTLVVFAGVCAGVLFRRYWVLGEGDSIKPVGLRLIGIILVSVGFSVSFTEGAPIAIPILFLVAWLVVTLSFYLLPVRQVPPLFQCPWSPVVPSFGVLACMHLIGSLGWPAYVRWVVWFTLGTTMYLCYGLHKTPDDTPAAGYVKTGGMLSTNLLPEGSRSSHHVELATVSVPLGTLSAHKRHGGSSKGSSGALPVEATSVDHSHLISVEHARSDLAQSD